MKAFKMFSLFFSLMFTGIMHVTVGVKWISRVRANTDRH